VNVTLDVFSALIDSRAGASPVFDRIAAREHWPLAGEELYGAWDRQHKRLQLECRRWEPFAALGRRALTQVLEAHQLAGDVDAAMEDVWSSLGDWPLWPDVDRGVHDLARRHRVGLLSNVDDDLLARTRVSALPLTPDLVITSQRVGRYKPDPALYQAARTIAGPSFVHVASSARDVRGALEAGVVSVRLVRPGHEVDPAGPRPAREVGGLDELAGYLAGAFPPG
jgi:2-haloacid dehalogenase